MPLALGLWLQESLQVRLCSLLLQPLDLHGGLVIDNETISMIYLVSS